MEYLAQVAREASNNRFKFSYAHDVLLPEVSPEVHVVPWEVCNIPVVSLGPRPPPFYLPFAFTIIHGSGRPAFRSHVLL